MDLKDPKEKCIKGPEEIPVTKNGYWRWVVLAATVAQCMVFMGVWSCGGIYMEAMKKVYSNRVWTIKIKSTCKTHFRRLNLNPLLQSVLHTQFQVCFAAFCLL